MPAKPAFAAVAEAVQPELEQAQMVDLAPVDEKAVDEDDLLDIPAFLRRQAN